MGPGGGGGANSLNVDTPDANSRVILVSYATVVCWKSAER